ncbi:hypothetical protein A9Q99_16990 [Gammaproteobacteria bacterium 45_16_T64]|nr:hypothetical protein A9Q99_16990 [Gammaproteobacteria bacterium 45_16_T64]
MERLSGLDASFLYMETRTMLMHVAFIAVCDGKDMPGGYSFRKIYDQIDVRTQREPVFRRRLIEVPFDLHHPLWIDDPEFNITDHVYQYTLPENATRADLGHKIGRIMSKPLDRTRPLWELWVIEGLEDGQFALMMKIHHAVVDGVSGTDLMGKLFDHEVVTTIPTIKRRAVGEPIPSNKELLSRALRSRVGGPKRFLKLLGESATGISALVKKRLKEDAEDRSTGPMSAPRTHFNRSIGPNRDVAFAELSLADLKKVKNATGATVNDVVLCVCGSALRNYLQMHDDLPRKSLVSMVPVSVRKPSETTVTNNQVSGMWATLATHVEDPLERLALIQKETKGAKDDHDAIGADLLQNWAEVNTPAAFNLAVRMYSSWGIADVIAPVHNTIISNVPGPRKPLYFAGCRIDTLYPLGPVMEGVGLNISLASYQDRVGFAIHVDADLVKDAVVFPALVDQALQDLKIAAGVTEGDVSLVG